jgi:hypothetical protein
VFSSLWCLNSRRAGLRVFRCVAAIRCARRPHRAHNTSSHSRTHQHGARGERYRFCCSGSRCCCCRRCARRYAATGCRSRIRSVGDITTLCNVMQAATLTHGRLFVLPVTVHDPLASRREQPPTARRQRPSCLHALQLPVQTRGPYEATSRWKSVRPSVFRLQTIRRDSGASAG